jgi:hypothetical protein
MQVFRELTGRNFVENEFDQPHLRLLPYTGIYLGYSVILLKRKLYPLAAEFLWLELNLMIDRLGKSTNPNYVPNHPASRALLQDIMPAHYDLFRDGEFIHRLAHGNVDDPLKSNPDELIDIIHLAFTNVLELISLISQIL